MSLNFSPKGTFMTLARLYHPMELWRATPRRSFFLMMILVILIGLSTGCTRQEGTAVSPAALSRIHEGVSTMADVRHILGKPDQIKTLLGNQTWIYRHSVRHGWFTLRTKTEGRNLFFFQGNRPADQGHAQPGFPDALVMKETGFSW
jgi:outer membrane protein assembly factor BamE (lipoprotein component of BamABCDE complex)